MPHTQRMAAHEVAELEHELSAFLAGYASQDPDRLSEIINEAWRDLARQERLQRQRALVEVFSPKLLAAIDTGALDARRVVDELASRAPLVPARSTPAPTWDHATVSVQEALLAVARHTLQLSTLVPQGSDPLDYRDCHDRHVTQLREALLAAYTLGQRDA